MSDKRKVMFTIHDFNCECDYCTKPLGELLAEAQAADAVDPQADSTGTPSTREKEAEKGSR